MGDICDVTHDDGRRVQCLLGLRGLPIVS